MADFGNDFKIKVSTEVMKSKADIVAGIVDRFAAQFEELDRKVNATAGYWVGNAGEQRRALYKTRMQEAEEIIRFLRSYTPELLQMAGIYEEGEQDNVETSGVLSSDVII